MKTKSKRKKQLKAHRNYSSITNRRIKFPDIFRGIFGIFRAISECLFIYLFIPRFLQVTWVGDTARDKRWNTGSLGHKRFLAKAFSFIISRSTSVKGICPIYWHRRGKSTRTMLNSTPNPHPLPVVDLRQETWQHGGSKEYLVVDHSSQVVFPSQTRSR